MLNRQEEKIKEYFDSTCESYTFASRAKPGDSLRSFIFSIRKAHILDMCKDGRGNLLDIGCGPAVLTEDLLRIGYKYYGVDISPQMIERANSFIPHNSYSDRCKFSVQRGERLDFPDNFFDCVLCIGVIEYLQDDSLILAEIKRVLKPLGKLILSVPNLASPFSLLDKTASVVIKTTLNLFKINPAFSRERLTFRTDIRDKYYFPGNLDRKLAGEGFIIEERRFHAFRIAMLNAILPRLSLLLARKSEMLSDSPLRMLGTNYIVKARKA